MKRASIFIVVLTAMSLGPSCAGRVHVIQEYGARTNDWHDKQRVYEVGAKERVEGLDSEEASAIHGDYRSAIGSGRTQKTEDPRVLILDEGATRGRRGN
jgi:hypothetical protein